MVLILITVFNISISGFIINNKTFSWILFDITERSFVFSSKIIIFDVSKFIDFKSSNVII